MDKTTNWTLNRPLAPTYRWLGVNGTPVPAFQAAAAPLLRWESAAGIREGAADAADIRTGMGLDGLFPGDTGNALWTWTAEAGAKAILRPGIQWNRDAGPAAGELRFQAEAGADLTVVLDLTASGDTSGALAALRTRAAVERDAVLRLAVLQRLDQQDTLFHDLGVRCGENARFEYVRLVLGGGTTYDGCSVALAGDRSAFAADIGYRVGSEGLLDMNCEAVHTGRRTVCAIRAAGVLRDHARKLFRGTIDFRKGCSGSVGNETEDVLLMDRTVRNSTAPAILCGEEDVEGNHGATIGRLDEALIYYLESRGMTREDIYALCARTRVDAVIRRIPDRETVRRLFPRLAEEEEAET